jgi:gamma-glutamylcyclotransferase (GGCT)/AIG2-like uncharacterized protein YtfP
MDLFTYGTLMSSDIMMRVAGCQLDSRPASLHGFFRSKVRDEMYPGIREEDGGEVLGLLYLEVPAEAIERLDLFEGEMYERRQVTVRLDSGEEKAVMTYIFRPQYHNLLTGIPWEYDEFLSLGKQKFEDGYLGFDALD